MPFPSQGPTQLSSPGRYLLRMAVFLILSGFVALILYKQIATAFMANPGLNGLILGVLAIGILLAIVQVVRLMREVRWANAYATGKAGLEQPVLLAPMATLLGQSSGPLSPSTLRAILDSIGGRLDEQRETARYLTGLLVFLGLLGTFWGLLETVGAIGGVIKSMQGGADAAVMFDDLKNGLSAPIAGMAISFTSSLFGLAGSLILGFLDLQAGQAQNRFFQELENNLSGNVTELTSEGGPSAMAMPAELRAALEKINSAASQGNANAAAMANLAEGIQSLVQHMRSEQQMVRDWVEAQAAQQREIRKLLERLAHEAEHR